MDPNKLIFVAKKAMERAYAPYSNYKVGAALVCDDGTVFKGCNIENASYGLTNCAERSAIFSAIYRRQWGRFFQLTNSLSISPGVSISSLT
jgi:cytidine deaminase